MEGELGYVQNPVDWFTSDPKYFHMYQDHIEYQAAISEGRLPIWKGEFLEGDEPMRKTVMLGIKMGMDRQSFLQTYGVDVIEAFSETWDSLQSLGLVEISPAEIRLTYLGKLFADEVGQQFYSDAIKRRMSVIDPHLVSTTWPQFNP